MKKSLFKPYLKSLIQQHIGYLVFDTLIIVLVIIFAILNFSKIPENTTKINQLKDEVTKLNNKYNAINSLNISNEDLKIYLAFLNKLIPSSEDYFSLIYTLETISRKTNFIIQAYTVNLKQSTKNKLKLTISGIGDKTAFTNFLKTYNFSGGRLMTSDSIELNPQLEGILNINVTFYNNKVVGKNSSDQFQKSLISLSEVAKLYNKTDFSLKDDNVNEVFDYPRKNNPF